MNHLKLGLIVLLISASAQAHHARFGFFSDDETIEITGVVTSLRWSNPHVHLELSVTNESGETVQWSAEMAALSSFRNRGISEPFVRVGETISLYGNTSRNGGPELSPSNLLREDGTEVILSYEDPPYFGARSTAQFVDPVASEESKQLARDAADGVFRVWIMTAGQRAFPDFYGDFPLTEAAAEIKSQWDSASVDLLKCWEKGMPVLMVTPHPIEFSRQGDDILMRYEEDDAERLIHMGEADLNAASSELGYSTGAWDGKTLVVETTKISAPAFDDIGTPQSPDVHLIERFTPTEDGERLDYLLTITDPATFTEPVELSRYWVWVPERTVQLWQCQDGTQAD